MRPYYETKLGAIYHGDCRDMLPSLHNIDLVLTDPPYDIHAGFGGGAFGKRAHLVNTGGFTDGGCDYSFLDLFDNWFCFCSLAQLSSLLLRANSKDRMNLLTWCKPNPVPTCNNKYLPDVEYVVHGFSKGRLFGNYYDKSSFFNTPCGSKKTDHPNEKPVSLIHKLVKLGSLRSEIILDPFLGSGTTAVACEQLRRRWVGIELSEEHCETSARRIEKEIAQLDLFEDAGPIIKPEQMELFNEN